MSVSTYLFSLWKSLQAVFMILLKNSQPALIQENLQAQDVGLFIDEKKPPIHIQYMESYPTSLSPEQTVSGYCSFHYEII